MVLSEDKWQSFDAIQGRIQDDNFVSEPQQRWSILF